MSFEFPSSLHEAVAAWLADRSQAGLRQQTQQLRQAYAGGQNSTSVDLAAYLSTRMPATFAAVSFVLREVTLVQPDFEPSSVLDVGAGPGTASFAAQAAWPSLNHFVLVEQDSRFATLAEIFAKGLLPNHDIRRQNLLSAAPQADLVTAAYVLAELPEEQAAKAALHLWTQTSHTLIFVEPGTPQGFARIRASRSALLAAGAHMIGPCSHASACPMTGQDWCHFKTRLPRSRTHMHAKGASVPFEDETFSWLAVSHFPATLPKARIIGPPSTNKVAVTMRVCDVQGLHDESFASRSKATYNAAKKLKWGEALPPRQTGND
ncbi:MAG: small ribosomal subunit Rsm22 family protein [Aestuariivirga sp.]